MADEGDGQVLVRQGSDLPQEQPHADLGSKNSWSLSKRWVDGSHIHIVRHVFQADANNRERGSVLGVDHYRVRDMVASPTEASNLSWGITRRRKPRLQLYKWAE
jgi:hypothetical protein